MRISSAKRDPGGYRFGRGGRLQPAVRPAFNALLLSLIWAAMIAPSAVAQMPDFYKSVDRVFWVVDDIDRTVAGWKRLGIIEIVAKPESRGIARWCVARLGDVTVDFIQPTSRDSVFSRYRTRHGQGVMALVHRVSGIEAVEEEVARMKKADVAVLASGDLRGEGRYTLFDTAEQGRYVLGLISGPEERGGPPATDQTAAVQKKVSQYAFVASDLEEVSKYWVRLGFPEMSFTHPALWDLHYHGRPGRFDAILGWQRHGNVVYEWIQPTVGPTTYMDHVSRHGEGLHHIAFEVTDFEQEKTQWSKAGYPTTQSGAWGERDRPGYGRFAYQNTDAIGGTEIELLWNFRR